VTTVHYVGDIGRNAAEVAENAVVDYTLPGNYAFWAERQQIYSSVDALQYRVQADSTIQIDGVAVELKQGDNVYAIIDKINASGAPVKARLDPVRSSLSLEGTFAHQIWPQDVGGGTVLQDLGIVRRGVDSPPLNISESAGVFGGSVFDMMMALRDSLYSGDVHRIGGGALRGIDDSLESLTAHLGEVGAKDARLLVTQQRLEHERPEVIQSLAQAVDLDITEAVTELKMLEYTHQAAVGTAARIIRPTLLDFLR
jgi:flagellar hook-associated protein 3 FlgL